MTAKNLAQAVTYTTITRYKYSGPEIHGHVCYTDAMGFAQSRMAVNGAGNVSIQLNHIEADGSERWIETFGGIR